jgi:hypothetical protein
MFFNTTELVISTFVYLAVAAAFAYWAYRAFTQKVKTTVTANIGGTAVTTDVEIPSDPNIGIIICIMGSSSLVIGLASGVILLNRVL